MRREFQGIGMARWSTVQACDLGSDPNLDILRGKAIVLCSEDSGAWSSVARTVDALNDGVFTDVNKQLKVQIFIKLNKKGKRSH